MKISIGALVLERHPKIGCRLAGPLQGFIQLRTACILTDFSYVDREMQTVEKVVN